MRENFSSYALSTARILLPRPELSYARWAVIACDQFTAQPAYWAETARIVGDSPSTLSMIYPEYALRSAPPDPKALHAAMRRALDEQLAPAVDGFVLVERQTSAGKRLGLVVSVDLSQYDYAKGAASLIRATEETVAERLPARMVIRDGAPLELPHILLLADDPGRTLIEPLYARRAALRPLYDFTLMQGGGAIRGWAVASDEDFAAVGRALEGLLEASGGLLFAVGDGNHSLATARASWVARGCPDDETRFALAELVNLHDPSLVFEPIHRAVFGADAAELAHDFLMDCRRLGIVVASCDDADAQFWLLDAPLRLENCQAPNALFVLQPFLDRWIASHPGASIDYIHGRDALDALHCCRIPLVAMKKEDLFPAVRLGGSLPRKSFSMGEARDKRYYLEARRLD